MAGFEAFIESVFNGFFAEAQNVHYLLSLLSFIGGILLIPFSIGEGPISKNCQRFSGSFFLLAISFEASSAWVYGVAVFVVATLIAELGFLTNLAAISWDRSWAFQRPATPKESEQKYRDDLGAESDSSEVLAGGQGEFKYLVSEKPEKTKVQITPESLRHFASTDKRILAGAAYEQDAFDALQQTGLFDDIQRETAITMIADTQRPLAIVDGIGRSGPSHYVIEVKRRISNLPRVIDQLRFAMSALMNTPELQRKLIKGPVRGLIICPPDQTRSQNYHDSIAYLLYDQDAKKFTNLEQVRKWVKGA